MGRAKIMERSRCGMKHAAQRALALQRAFRTVFRDFFCSGRVAFCPKIRIFKKLGEVMSWG
jgi:hypothetical protein